MSSKLVMCNPKTNKYHEYNSYQGRRLRIPNKNGDKGIPMAEKEAIKAGYKKSLT